MCWKPLERVSEELVAALACFASRAPHQAKVLLLMPAVRYRPESLHRIGVAEKRACSSVAPEQAHASVCSRCRHRIETMVSPSTDIPHLDELSCQRLGAPVVLIVYDCVD